VALAQSPCLRKSRSESDVVHPTPPPERAPTDRLHLLLRLLPPPGKKAKRLNLPGEEAVMLISEVLPSPGSREHFDDSCTPCLFFSKGSCRKGNACAYCHYQHATLPRNLGQKHRKQEREQERERVKRQIAAMRGSMSPGGNRSIFAPTVVSARARPAPVQRNPLHEVRGEGEAPAAAQTVVVQARKVEAFHRNRSSSPSNGFPQDVLASSMRSVSPQVMGQQAPGSQQVSASERFLVSTSPAMPGVAKAVTRSREGGPAPGSSIRIPSQDPPARKPIRQLSPSPSA